MERKQAREREQEGWERRSCRGGEAPRGGGAEGGGTYRRSRILDQG